MRVAIRVDASAAMGTGHLRRCLSLAEALVELGVQVTLVTRSLDHVAQHVLIDDPGFAVQWLAVPASKLVATLNDLPLHHAWAGVPWEQDARQTVAALQVFCPDWLVVDHYAFDARWHATLRRELGCRLVVIDDTADRPLEPDVLVDSSWNGDHCLKYANRLTRDPRWLVGPRYALLSRAYRDAQRYVFNETVSSIGVFMGGTDPENHSLMALTACREVAGFQKRIEIISTSANANLAALREGCQRWPNTVLHVDQPDLSAFFARHDLQIGAGGGATWERCCIGVPSLLMAFATNQEGIVRQLGEQGVAAPVQRLTLDCVGMAVRTLIDQPRRRESMAARGRALVDGRGSLRVALVMAGEHLTLGVATPADAEGVFPWRNDELIRRYFRNRDPLDLDSHIRWWNHSLSIPARRLLIASVGGCKVGVIRFDINSDSAEVSLYLSPRFLGLGLGVAMLKAGTVWAQQHLPAIRYLTAEVLPENHTSIRAFSVTGYSQITPNRWLLEFRS